MVESAFKQIAIHPDDRENCITEPKVCEPITILKHFNANVKGHYIEEKEENQLTGGLEISFVILFIFFLFEA